MVLVNTKDVKAPETLLAGIFTHISLGYGTYANSIAPDATSQNVASHLGLFCLQRGFSSKNYMKY